MFRAKIKIALVMIFVLGLVMSAFAQEAAEEKKIEVLSKKLNGEIGGVSSSFLAVVYAIDANGAREMAMNIDKNTKVVNKKGVSDLKVGDTVSVVYEETTETIKVKKEDKEENKVKVRGRVAKLITVTKAAPEPEAIPTNTLVSDDIPDEGAEEANQ